MAKHIQTQLRREVVSKSLRDRLAAHGRQFEDVIGLMQGGRLHKKRL